MVWYDLAHSLVALLVVSLWRSQVQANIPLMADDVPEEKREETLRNLQKGLLKSLGMKNRPSASTKTSIPQYMIDLYNQQINDPDSLSTNFKKHNTLHSNTARSYSHIGTKSHTEDHNKVNLYFNVTSLPDDEEMVAAELQLFRHNSSAQNDTYKLNIYEIISNHNSVEKAITRLIDTQTVSNDKEWQHLDITPAAQRWRQKPKKYLGIQVHFKKTNGKKTLDNHIRLRRDAESRDSEWNAQKPLVVVYSYDTKHPIRTKRGTGRRKNRRNKAANKQIKMQCQRHEMKVRFDAVGWDDWVVAPNDYDAYYCQGECSYFPLPDHLNTSNHAIIQTLMNFEDSQAVPKVCCIPTELSPMALLYVEDGGVTLKNYRDMTVESCGCR